MNEQLQPANNTPVYTEAIQNNQALTPNQHSHTCTCTHMTVTF